MVIGIVGGMGSYATLDFFERLLETFPANKEWERPRIIIDNNCTMPSRVRAVLYGENRKELVASLVKSIEGLIDLGATHVILACNTSHCFLNEIYSINPNLKNYVLDIVSNCKAFITKNNINDIFFLGTEGTILSGIYEKGLDKTILSAPLQDDFLTIRNFIEKAKTNSITKTDCIEFNNYLGKVKQKYVLLGCTELPIYIKKNKEFNLTLNKIIIDPLELILLRIRSLFYD